MGELKGKAGKPCARKRLGISCAVWMKMGVAKRCYIACLALSFLKDFGYLATGLAPWLLDVLELGLILWLLMMATEKE